MPSSRPRLSPPWERRISNLLRTVSDSKPTAFVVRLFGLIGVPQDDPTPLEAKGFVGAVPVVAIPNQQTATHILHSERREHFNALEVCLQGRQPGRPALGCDRKGQIWLRPARALQGRYRYFDWTPPESLPESKPLRERGIPPGTIQIRVDPCLGATLESGRFG